MITEKILDTSGKKIKTQNTTRISNSHKTIERHRDRNRLAYSIERTIPPIPLKDDITSFYLFKLRLQQTLLMLIAVPFAIIWGSVSSFISGFFYLLRGPEAIRKKKTPTPPTPSRHAKEIADFIRKIPFRSLPIPSRLATTLAYLPDMVNYFLDSKPKTRCVFYHYPPSFEEATITLTQGVKHKITIGRHPGSARPTIIIVHGLFNTKNHAMQQRIALDLYHLWGYNVAIPDLRDFGETADIQEAPIYGSYQEGQDMVELAKILKQHYQATTVGLMGYSFGGATAMQSAYHNQENAIDGGILAFNGFTDNQCALEYIDQRPAYLSEFFPVYLFFKWVFISRVRNRYKKQDIRSFNDYIRKIVLPSYGGNLQNFYYRNSVIYKAHLIDSPLLAIHAEDDPVVLVEHTKNLIPISAKNNNVQVIITPTGGHYGYWLLSRPWLRQVIRSYFGYWNQEPGGNDRSILQKPKVLENRQS